jgi:hypothetical protein
MNKPFLFSHELPAHFLVRSPLSLFTGQRHRSTGRNNQVPSRAHSGRNNQVPSRAHLVPRISFLTVGWLCVTIAQNNTHVNYLSKTSQDFLFIVSALRIIFF